MRQLLFFATLFITPITLFAASTNYRDEIDQLDRMIEFSIQSTQDLNLIKEQFVTYVKALDAVKVNPNDKTALVNLVRSGSALHSSLSAARLQKNFSADFISELAVLKQFSEKGNGS